MTTKRLELTAIVHTYNEENNIMDCLETLRWVDELIVVDSYSTDRTVEIARHYTDKIFFFEYKGYVEPSRNFSLEKATKEWILYVDADERVTEDLKQNIIDTVLTGIKPVEFVVDNADLFMRKPVPAKAEINLYCIPFKDYMFGRWVTYGTWGKPKEYIRRLMRKNKAVWDTKVHGFPQVEGEISTLEGEMLHFSHLEISRWITKLNAYTSPAARDKYNEGKHYSWPNSVLLTFYQFYNVYIKGKAYKDGEHGLVLALLMCMYSFTYRLKIWELNYRDAHKNEAGTREFLAEPQKTGDVAVSEDTANSTPVQAGNENTNIQITNTNFNSQYANFNRFLEASLLQQTTMVSIEKIITKLNNDTSIEAKENFNNDKKHSWVSNFYVFLVRFLLVYFKNRNFRYGSRGFVQAMLSAFYVLVLRLKLWELYYKANHPNTINQHAPLASPVKPELNLELVKTNE